MAAPSTCSTSSLGPPRSKPLRSVPVRCDDGTCDSLTPGCTNGDWTANSRLHLVQARTAGYSQCDSLEPKSSCAARPSSTSTSKHRSRQLESWGLVKHVCTQMHARMPTRTCMPHPICLHARTQARTHARTDTHAGRVRGHTRMHAQTHARTDASPRNARAHTRRRRLLDLLCGALRMLA
jgi:hypothetical protein